MVLASPKTGDGAAARVVRYAEAEIPTGDGPLRLVVFREIQDGVPSEDAEHVALIVGDPLLDPDDVLVRVHSECITSEVFGSLKCDCREQLHGALGKLRDKGAGIIIYLRQEGRGIGLGNKIRAYALQARGYDTVDANRLLGLPDDTRSYGAAAAILEDLGVRSIRIMTNNPRKIRNLEELGVLVEGRIPVLTCTNPHSQAYLEAKAERMGHMLGPFAVETKAN